MMQTESVTSQDSGLEVLEGEQLKRYLRNCIELTQSKKVTVKNAFDLKAIDNLISLSKSIDKDNEEFSLASMSLQASGKIYGYRVDSVYVDAFRLAMEVPKRRSTTQPKTGVLDGDLDEPQRNKRRRYLSSFLADEGANDSPIEIDHGLRGNPYMSAIQSAHGNALGRLMSYNLMPPETRGIDVEGNFSWWSKARIKTVHSKVSLRFRQVYRPLMIENVQLNFDLPAKVKTEDSTSDVDEDTSPRVDDITPMEMSDLDSDSVTLLDSGDVTDVDSGGNSIHDRPGDFSSIYENSFKSFKSKSRSKKKSRAPHGQKQQSQYLFLRNCIAELDELAPNDEHDTMVSTFKWVGDATVLFTNRDPEVECHRFKQLFALPNRPEFYDERRLADNDFEGEQTDADDSADDIVDPSEAAADPFMMLDSEADRMDSDYLIPMSQPGEDRRFDDLISAPGILAEVLEVHYRKKAKQLNMRQMKKSFWNVLMNSASSKKMTGNKSFRQMYREAVPQLSEMNRKNIDIPIAFVTTLSLCNEKHLQLTRKHEDDSADFFVGQAPVSKSS